MTIQHDDPNDDLLDIPLPDEPFELPASADAAVGSAAAPRRTTPQVSGFVPVDPMAEAAVLAAILTAPKVFDEVNEQLDAADFGTRNYADIYQAIKDCESSGRPFDQITVADELAGSKSLARIGGAPALARLCETAVNVANVSAYVEIVLEKSRLRRLVEAAQDIQSAAMAADAKGDTALERAEQVVFEIGKPRNKSSLVGMPEAVAEMLADLENYRNRSLVGISTGFDYLDKLTGGFQPGQLIIVAARPAMGKSALSLQLARNLAVTSGKAVPFLSYEMGRNELMLRLLSNTMGYDMGKLRRGDLPDDRAREMAEHVEALGKVPLFIDDNPAESIGGVRSAMRRFARKQEIGAIVIDYLQLMAGDGRRKDDNRTQEISDISRGLKRLATELGVPVIALSQLNRTLETRPGGQKRPILSDLRESGSIEQDANTVMFIYREHVYNPTADPTHAELILGKQRNGPLGTVYLDFLADQGGRFHNTDRTSAPASAPEPSGGPGAGRGFGGGGFGGGGGKSSFF